MKYVHKLCSRFISIEGMTFLAGRNPNLEFQSNYILLQSIIYSIYIKLLLCQIFSWCQDLCIGWTRWKHQDLGWCVQPLCQHLPEGSWWCRSVFCEIFSQWEGI